jgi:hypothetical protein
MGLRIGKQRQGPTKGSTAVTIIIITIYGQQTVNLRKGQLLIFRRGERKMVKSSLKMFT